jgi:glycerol-3-phosphate acyltransferase PlsY
MLLAVSLVLCYLIGSIPTSYIFAKALKGIDIRKFGSGNVGATNTYRVVGKLPGLLVLVIDILKGLICVALVAKLFLRLGVTVEPEAYGMMLGFAAIVGHIWSVFLGFKGGKGVATSAGVFIGVAPRIFLLGLAVWVLIFVWKRYVSLASITTAVAVPVIFSALSYPASYVIFGSLVCAVTVYKHYPNIKRLARGEENRISFKKKEGAR